jgi:uncharacterized protein YndB with AHSA1/START domain
MIEFELTEHFDHPPERILTALTDLDRLGAWMPDFVAVERLEGGDYGVGSTWLETRHLFGREATEHVEVVALDPPKRLVLEVDGSKGTSRRGEYRFTYTLTPEDGGTRVTLRGEGSGLGTLGRVVGRFLLGPFERACRRDVRALRRWLDEGGDREG